MPKVLHVVCHASLTDAWSRYDGGRPPSSCDGSLDTAAANCPPRSFPQETAELCDRSQSWRLPFARTSRTSIRLLRRRPSSFDRSPAVCSGVASTRSDVPRRVEAARSRTRPPRASRAGRAPRAVSQTRRVVASADVDVRTPCSRTLCSAYTRMRVARRETSPTSTGRAASSTFARTPTSRILFFFPSLLGTHTHTH